MFPIFEQGHGKGIGLDLDSFLWRFDSICEEHQRSGRAKSFAFIFYNFEDRDLKRILKDERVFTQLDRLSGSELSIFFLHTGAPRSVERFNSEFFSRIHVSPEAIPPCVVFFNLSKDGFTNIAVAQLDSANLLQGFHELYVVIERYIKSPSSAQKAESQALRWIKSGSKLMSLEALRAALRAVFGQLF